MFTITNDPCCLEITLPMLYQFYTIHDRRTMELILTLILTININH